MNQPLGWPEEAPCTLWGRSFAHKVPGGDDWLSKAECEVQNRFRIEKRRSDWRLGRWALKQLVLRWGACGVRELQDLEVLAAEDGAPELYVAGRHFLGSVSITHRQRRAIVAVAPNSVGCDLEWLEPKSDGLIQDFMTPLEQRYIADTSPNTSQARTLRACLVWSAKESALKVMRTGLRRDTRQVEVRGVTPCEGLWGTFLVHDGPTNQTWRGRWTHWDDYIWTLCGGGERIRQVDLET